MYYTGQGVSKNLVQAYAWLDVSFSNGDKNAGIGLKELAKDMSSNQIDKAKRLSLQLAKDINQKKKM